MLSRENVRIENARLYPSAIVDQLRVALLNGAELHVDETRKNFYELHAGLRTYFIFVSPASRNVTLIATWAQKRPPVDTRLDGQAPWWRRIATHIFAVPKTLSKVVLRDLSALGPQH
jgi:hypothetical protein